MAFVSAPSVFTRVSQRRSCCVKRVRVRCCAPVYLDDPFGGFKSTRKSAESDSWGASGEQVLVHERSSTSVFTSEVGVLAEEADIDVLVIVGFPSPCYLARGMIQKVVSSTPRSRAVSFDWPGIGESDSPQDGLKGFSYNVESALEAVRGVVRHFAMGENERSLYVVTHGYLGTHIGTVSANEFKAKGVVLLAPALAAARELPPELRKLRNPIFGPLLTGNPAHMADKVFSSATPYGIDEKDMMVLRSPFMRSGGPGFAARATACNINWTEESKCAMNSVEKLTSPTHFVVAENDRWLKNNIVDVKKMKELMLANGNSNTEVTQWEYAGHFIFDDQPDESGQLVADFINRIQSNV